jgi:branched-subunit amino acid ABC-type transport system permease component
MDLLLAQAIANGLLIGAIYGLAALGLTLVWGIMDVVNLAHGEFVLFGAYLTFVLFSQRGAEAGLNPLLSLLVVIPAGLLLGTFLYRFLLQRVVGRPALTTLLLTFGLSILFNNVLLNWFGPDVRIVRWAQGSLVVGGVALPWTRLIAFTLVMLVSLGLFFFLQRSYAGKAIRAVMQDAEAAGALGIDTQRVLTTAFALGTMLAMVAGVLVSVALSFSPANGVQFSVTSFVICVVGGLGRPLGAMLGGLIVGLVESFTGVFITQAYTPAMVSLLLVGFLLVRPQGLFGRPAR